MKSAAPYHRWNSAVCDGIAVSTSAWIWRSRSYLGAARIAKIRGWSRRDHSSCHPSYSSFVSVLLADPLKRVNHGTLTSRAFPRASRRSSAARNIHRRCRCYCHPPSQRCRGAWCYLSRRVGGEGGGNAARAARRASEAEASSSAMGVYVSTVQWRSAPVASARPTARSPFPLGKS